ncbi:MAG: hypothetical protein WCC48_05170 [Anaeromyxobacteraceae bacterium]
MPRAEGWLAFLLVTAPFGTARAEVASKPRVAVFELRTLGPELPGAERVSDLELTEAASFRELRVIGGPEIVALVGARREREMAGCAEDSPCIAEIGGRLAVDYLLLGSLARVGDRIRLELKLVEAKRPRVVARYGDSISGGEDATLVSVQRGVRSLLLPVARPESSAAPPAPAAEPPPPARSGRRIAAWAVGGAGLACVAGGAAVGVLAQQAYDSQRRASDGASYDRYRKLAKDRILQSNALYGAGAVGIGAGAWLFFGGKEPPELSVGALPLGDGALAFVAGGF